MVAIFIVSKFRSKLNSRDGSILIKCFFLATLTVIPSLIIKHTAAELGFGERINSLFGKIGFAAFSGFVDELNKYIIIIAYAYRKKEFDEPMAGILICIMIGMGFITAENVWHLADSDKYIDSWRMLFSIPVALICAIILGYFSGLSKYGLDADDLSSFGLRFKGLALAVLFHSFYTFFLFMEDYKSLTTLIVLVSAIALIQVGLNLYRAQRLHTRLKFSRKRRSGTSEGAIF